HLERVSGVAADLGDVPAPGHVADRIGLEVSIAETGLLRTALGRQQGECKAKQCDEGVRAHGVPLSSTVGPLTSGPGSVPLDDLGAVSFPMVRGNEATLNGLQRIWNEPRRRASSGHA